MLYCQKSNNTTTTLIMTYREDINMEDVNKSDSKRELLKGIFAAEGGSMF